MGLAGQAYGSNDSVDKMFEVMDMERQMNGGFEAMLPLIDQMAAQFRLDATGKEELTTNLYRTRDRCDYRFLSNRCGTKVLR